MQTSLQEPLLTQSTRSASTEPRAPSQTHTPLFSVGVPKNFRRSQTEVLGTPPNSLDAPPLSAMSQTNRASMDDLASILRKNSNADRLKPIQRPPNSNAAGNPPPIGWSPTSPRRNQPAPVHSIGSAGSTGNGTFLSLLLHRFNSYMFHLDLERELMELLVQNSAALPPQAICHSANLLRFHEVSSVQGLRHTRELFHSDFSRCGSY